MSMMPPPFSADPSDEGIPAADPGAGAPEPAPGFGIEGEDPDVAPGGAPEDDEGRPAASEPPFRTPDPKQVGQAQPKRPEM
jgi:hypothetical protein